jgi:hypothetical protein
MRKSSGVEKFVLQKGHLKVSNIDFVSSLANLNVEHVIKEFVTGQGLQLKS